MKKSIKLTVKKLLQPSLKLSGHEENRQKTLLRLVENCLNYTLYFFMIYWVLDLFGLPVSSLLAGAGIAGVAIGLGAQGFLSDLVNGFFILLERQFDVGDAVVLINGSIKVTGNIVSVGIRTTQVRDYDGTLHFVPNRNITVVSNLSRGNMRVQIDLPLSSDTHLSKVAHVIHRVNQEKISDYPEILAPPKLVGPQQNTNGQLVYRIHLTVKNGQQTAIYAKFYSYYQAALYEQGIVLLTSPMNIK